VPGDVVMALCFAASFRAGAWYMAAILLIFALAGSAIARRESPPDPRERPLIS
jgi:hypothetical protein